MRVLIVDDNIDNRLLLSEIIEELGYDYSVAGNGREALDFMNKNTYDVVLMDLEMPVMNGVETTVLIRKTPPKGHEKVTIIAITAHCPHEFLRKYFSKGFSDFLSKPFTLETIQAAIIRNTGM